MLRKICFLLFQFVFNFKANRRHSQEHIFHFGISIRRPHDPTPKIVSLASKVRPYGQRTV